MPKHPRKYSCISDKPAVNGHLHWVYGGTCFRFDQRGKTDSGRPVILSRGTVMTRGGMDALREQLFAECIRHGGGHVAEVLVVADGAIWIWNLVSDRFKTARAAAGFLPCQPASVGQGSCPESGRRAAHQWIEPLLKKLKAGRAVQVIDELKAVTKRLGAKRRATAQSGLDYFQTDRDRLDYHVAKKRGHPLGSGAIESTCRHQSLCRPGSFFGE